LALVPEVPNEVFAALIRTPGGRPVRQVLVSGTTIEDLTRDSIVIPRPDRGKDINIRVDLGE
jgi:hypothetical protein